MKKRHGESIALSEVLKEFVQNNKLEKGIDKVQVTEIWYTMMGPAIKKYTTDIKLDRNTLYIGLSSSVLREELSYGKQKIIKMLNEELGKDLIKQLVLR